MKKIVCLIICSAFIIIAGCTTLVLKPADFSWPIEVVLKPDAKGIVQESRYQVSFNVKALLFEELRDSINVTKHSLHVIRDASGYYFIVGKGFKNVYVFNQGEGALKLEKKILISEKELEAPAFNQKAPFIQLVNESNDKVKPIMLTKDGIQEGGKK